MGTLSWRKLTPTAQGIHDSHGSATGRDVANVPKGWHIPEGLTRVTGQLCTDQALCPKGWDLVGDSCKFPALGINPNLSELRAE